VQGTSTPKTLFFYAYFIYYNFFTAEKRLNSRNSSKQELIMEIFVCAERNYINMHTKFQIMCKLRYL
jgi:hypothetical protein